MAQDFDIPFAGSTTRDVALKTNITNALIALRSGFSGASEPSSTVAYQTWLDTTTGLVKRRNAGNTDWNVEGVIGVEPLMFARVEAGNISATGSKKHIFIAPRPVLISHVAIVGDTTTTDSSGNEHTFALTNATQTEELFDATVGTFTVDGEIGGGDLTQDEAYRLTATQNQSLAADDVLNFSWTKSGTADDIANAVLFLFYSYR